MRHTTIVSSIACVAMLVCAPLVHAANNPSATTKSGASHDLPVLVSVDRNGQVTHVDAAYPVKQDMQALIDSTVQRMITGPIKKNGQPVDGNAVLHLRVSSIEQPDGHTSITLAYAGSEAVPAGQWEWVHPPREVYGPVSLRRVSPDADHRASRDPSQQYAGFTRGAVHQTMNVSYDARFGMQH